MINKPIRLTSQLINRLCLNHFCILKEKLREVFPQKLERAKQIKKKYSKEVIHKISLNEVFNGMNHAPCLYHATSFIDKSMGVIMRGYTYDKIKNLFPKGKDQSLSDFPNSQTLPEAYIWLFLLGEAPSAEDFVLFQEEFLQRDRNIVDDDLKKFIKNLPKEMHPMTQLSSSVLFLQTKSQFFQGYSKGIGKKDYWLYVYEDVMNLISAMPHIASLVYRHTYENDDFIHPDYSLDWSANFIHMLGKEKNHFQNEAMRCFLSILCEHDGGNVCTHTTHLTGSALADPFLAYSAGINGLAGASHGLADQDFWRFILKIEEELGLHPSEGLLKEYLMEIISEDLKIPGFGHSITNYHDTRNITLQKFAQQHLSSHRLFNLINQVEIMTPQLLLQYTPLQNPKSNAYVYTGLILNSIGIKNPDFNTVCFAVSRSIGALTNLIWDRALGFPIERPSSIDIQWIENRVGTKNKKFVYGHDI